MREFKGTPGPWDVDGFNLTAVLRAETGEGITQDWTTYTHVCDCNYGYADPEKYFELNKANARLIAAAPELLEALQGLLEDLEDETLQTSMNESINRAKSVIAKVLGTPVNETDPITQSNIETDYSNSLQS